MSKKASTDGANETMDTKPSFSVWMRERGAVTSVATKPSPASHSKEGEQG